MAKDPIETLEKIINGLDAKAEKILNDIAFQIKKRVDSQEFIHWKSKRKPIVVEKARMVGQLLKVEVRTASRWTWGLVLVGPPGSTTIRPKKSFLAIPTDFARTSKSVRGVFGPGRGGMEIFSGIVWGKAGWGGSVGLRQHRAAGKKFGKQTLVPMFILKGSVIVGTKVHPADLEQWGMNLLREKLIKAKILKP